MYRPRRSSIEAPKFATKVRLVGIADFDRDGAQGPALEQQMLRLLHATLDQIRVRRHAHRFTEFAQQMERAQGRHARDRARFTAADIAG